MKKTFRTKLVRDGAMCAIEIPFDPKKEFGKARAPVTVTLNGYTYRSTIAPMGEHCFVPLRASHREAAGLTGDETLDVTIALDEEKREVTPPEDFVAALKAAPPAWERWSELSFTHQREYVEALADAKQPATRARRMESSVKAIAERPAKKRK